MPDLTRDLRIQDTVTKVLELLESGKDVRKGTWSNKEVRLTRIRMAFRDFKG